MNNIKDNDFLSEIYDNLRQDHENFVKKKAGKSDQKGTVRIMSETLSVSPFSLLMQLLADFAVEYVVNGKIKFNVWHFKRNFNFIITTIEFFKKLFAFYKK